MAKELDRCITIKKDSVRSYFNLNNPKCINTIVSRYSNELSSIRETNPVIKKFTSSFEEKLIKLITKDITIEGSKENIIMLFSKTVQIDIATLLEQKESAESPTIQVWNSLNTLGEKIEDAYFKEEDPDKVTKAVKHEVKAVAELILTHRYDEELLVFLTNKKYKADESLEKTENYLCLKKTFLSYALDSLLIPRMSDSSEAIEEDLNHAILNVNNDFTDSRDEDEPYYLENLRIFREIKDLGDMVEQEIKALEETNSKATEYEPSKAVNQLIEKITSFCSEPAAFQAFLDSMSKARPAFRFQAKESISDNVQCRVLENLHVFNSLKTDKDRMKKSLTLAIPETIEVLDKINS